MPFIDLHCHILPGLDDGAEISDDSLQMAKVALDGGSAAIICTPHTFPRARYAPNDFRNAMIDTKEALRDSEIALPLYPGQEIFLPRGEDAHGIAEALERSALLTLNRSVYPLIEFDPYETAEAALDAVDILCASGFVPVIAHPERDFFIFENPNAASLLHEHGALLQLNKGSITGFFGRDVADTAHELLRAHLADFVASDAHSPYRRTPDLREAHEWISENLSESYADFLLWSNPARVLKNEKILPY